MENHVFFNDGITTSISDKVIKNIYVQTILEFSVFVVLMHLNLCQKIITCFKLQKKGSLFSPLSYNQIFTVPFLVCSVIMEFFELPKQSIELLTYFPQFLTSVKQCMKVFYRKRQTQKIYGETRDMK